jgi:hypothetical protein
MNNPTDEELVQRFLAEGGVPLDPILPENWDCTPNQSRPACHWLLKGKPYVKTIVRNNGAPDSVQYEVRMFDGKCWDRSTWFGSYRSPVEAKAKAESLVR